MAAEGRCPQLPNFRPIKGTKLYRTSSLLHGREKHIQDMMSLKIGTVIDFQAVTEYIDFKDPALDDHYMKLTTVDNAPYHALDETMKEDMLQRDAQMSGKRKFGLRYYCNFIDFSMIRMCLWHCPWYKKPLFALLYLIDMVIFGYVRYSMLIYTYWMNQGSLLDNLIGIADWRGDVVNDVLRLLLVPSNCPAVLMCGSGKDRTGLVSALIQIVCQVDRDTIIADFAQSDEGLRPIREMIIKKMKTHGVHSGMAYAPPEVMRGLLKHLDQKYGSVPAYLESIGFSLAMQEKLRQNVETSQLHKR